MEVTMAANDNGRTRDDFLRDVVGDLILIRRKQGLTQDEINHRLGVADRLVSKWECGVRTPSSFSLYCWADALDSRLVVIENASNPIKLQASNDNT